MSLPPATFKIGIGTLGLGHERRVVALNKEKIPIKNNLFKIHNKSGAILGSGPNTEQYQAYFSRREQAFLVVRIAK